MKTQKQLVLISLLTLAALLLVAAPVAAEGKVIECSGTETAIVTLDPGTFWITPDGNIEVRGVVTLYRSDSTNPMCSGYNTVVSNASLKPNGVGPIWGTFETQNDKCPSDEPCGFKGVWTGQSTKSIYELHGSGIGTGSNQGVTLTVTDVNGKWHERIFMH